MVKVEPGRLREPAAWIMLTVVCAQVLVGVERLLIGSGLPFGTRSSITLSTLTSPVYVALAVGAIVLVTRFGPPTPRARLVNLIAVVALAVAALFGAISLIGVLIGGGTGGLSLIEYLLTGLPALGLTAVGLVYAMAILPPAAPSASRPRQESFGMRPGEGSAQGVVPGFGPQQGHPGQPGPQQGFHQQQPGSHQGYPEQQPGSHQGYPEQRPGPQHGYAEQASGPQQGYPQQQGNGAFNGQGAYQPPPSQGENGAYGAPGGHPEQPSYMPSPDGAAGAPPSGLPALPPPPGSYAPQHSQPLDQYAPAQASDPYAQGPQNEPRPQAPGAYEPQQPSYEPQPSGAYEPQGSGAYGQQGSGAYGQQPASPYAPQPAGQPQQVSDPYAPQAASPYPSSGGGTGAFAGPDAFTTGALQAVPAPEPLTAPTAFDLSSTYGQPQSGATYGQTGPQSSPLDQPSSYGQTGPQSSPLDQPSSYGQTGSQPSPLDQPSSYGQTGPQSSPLDQPSSYGQTGSQPSPLDQPSSYGQTGPQSSPLDQPSSYGQSATQPSSYGQAGAQPGGESLGGYASGDFGRPGEPSQLYPEAVADPRQQQIAHAYQQAQSYQQQSQGAGAAGTPADGRFDLGGGQSGASEHTGTQPVRTPDYTASYGASPFGHPQSPADSAAYPRPAGDSQPYHSAQDHPYPPVQDQPYQQEQPNRQAQPAWDEPASEKTVRFDPKAYQNDPLNAPMPPPASQGRRDEPLDPTAIYAPDRSAQARPEESDGRDPAGPGVDQGARWYGSDR
ncbi:hypothetical protein [Sphaerisporangium perillae]|uniref:hypothetical protein n=1 Tax=Sphaerisporangium perillae TaxID=2935860 RepID=UPI00200CED7D|nr:hypothetical protein [Sphaerisporangium perillae]